MQQLEKGVLAVGAWLAPVDRPRVAGDRRALERHRLAVAFHRELLQVGGETLEVLVVGDDGDGLGAEEVRVPHRQQAHQHRQVAVEGRGAEVLVHLVKAAEHVAKVLGADCQHGRQSDGRIHGVATANPVPELEHVVGVDAECGDGPCVGGNRDEVFGNGCLGVPEAGEQPVARGMRVGHRLERGERLGRDDEQRLGRVQVARGFGEVGAVDVRDEAEGHVALGVRSQRFVGHHRAQVRAADADVDHVADALAGEARPRSRSHARGEIGHAIQHGVDVLDHVVAVDQQAWRRGVRAARRARPSGSR